MTHKQITRQFLKRADALSTRELVFFDEYINSVASKDVFPPVRQLANCVEELFQALPRKTLLELELNRSTHMNILFNTLDMLLHPGERLSLRESTYVAPKQTTPRKNLRRKK